ncbi:GxxExxY protein [Lutibacter sp.]
MSKLLYEKESYAIIGTCIKIHKKIGTGFKEAVYTEILQKELEKRNIPFEKDKKLQLYYDGVALSKHCTADFVCYNKIIIQVKSVNSIKEEAIHQTVNYLKATNFKLGLLINFGESSLKWKRLINTAVPI